LSVPGREVVKTRTDLTADSPPIKHFHPGEEIIYVLAASLEYQIEGHSTVTLQAGDVLTVPARAVHSVSNVGSGTASELATYAVEKGEPLLTVVQ
jgi:quercetin dioxygenase-like cupin family protein